MRRIDPVPHAGAAAVRAAAGPRRGDDQAGGRDGRRRAELHRGGGGAEGRQRRALRARPAGQGRPAGGLDQAGFALAAGRRERPGADAVRLAPAARRPSRARAGRSRSTEVKDELRHELASSRRPASCRTSPPSSTTSSPPARRSTTAAEKQGIDAAQARAIDRTGHTAAQRAARRRPPDRRHPDADLRRGPGRDLAARADPGRPLLHVPGRRASSPPTSARWPRSATR